MKRKICSFVALTMLVSTIAVPNLAGAKTSDFADYASVAMPENMMNNPTSGNVFGNANSSTVDKKFSASDWNTEYNTYNGYQITANSETSNTGAYANVSGVTMADDVPGSGMFEKALVSGKSYVLSFLARNNGTTDSFKINMGLTDSVTTWTPTYTLEKGEEGYTVADKVTWTKIAGTFVAPCTRPFLSIGFMNGEPQGSSMEFNLAYLPEEAIYFAEEVAYELNVTADVAEAEKGDTINASAEVLNQIGTTGTLSQDFDWYVVNEDRTVVVEEFDVNVSGNTAQITVGDEVANGNYVIVAIFDGNMAKGFPVTVTGGSSGGNPGDDSGMTPEDFNDTTPTKPKNMMNNPTSGNVFGNANISTVDKKFSASDWNTEYNTYNGYQITANSETSNTGAYANVSGVTMADDVPGSGMFEKALVSGKSYVLSFLARNNGTTDSFKINMGLTDSVTTWMPTYTLEKGEGGYTVADKVTWTKIAGTFIAPCTRPFLSIGFMNGEPQGSSMEFNLAYLPEEAIYFAEEVAYELNVTADKTELENGEKVTVSAELLNQVGTKGTLSQDFDWYVVNEDRTEQIAGFTISGSGNTAEITVGDAVEAGNYVIVAVSDGNTMIKGVPLTIAGETTGEEPGDDPDDGEFDEEPGDYSDTTIPVPVNMMNNPHHGNVFGNENASNTVEKKANDKSELWNTTYEYYSGYFIEAKETVQSQGASYANVSGVTMADDVPGSGMFEKALVPGKAYVLSFLARNVGTTDDFKVNFGLTNTTNWTSVSPIENNGEGFSVSEKEEWTKVAGTIVAPHAAPFLSIGFINGTEKGSKMEFNLCYLPDEAIYFAEEIPYNMEVTHNGAEILDNGSTVVFETKVTNQIGSTGNLTQNAKYYVVNEERNAKVAGFKFTSDDGKKVMQIGEDVEPGIYYVIAENIDNPTYKKGIKIQTQRKYQSDHIPEESGNAGEPHDITVSIVNQKASYSFLDAEAVSAGVCDINDSELSGYEFEWKAYKENRRDEEENIILTPSDDTKTAEISFTPAIKNGKYYIMARRNTPALLGEGMQRAIEIVVNNTSAYEQVSSEINGGTVGDIEAKLDTYADYADMPEDIYEIVDKHTLASVMEKTEFSASNVKDTMLSAAIVSLYVNNPQSVTLNNSEDLSFEYADELGLTALADSGVTLMSLYNNTLSKSQRSNVIDSVNGHEVVSPKTFIEKLCESIILEGVKKSETMLGSGFVLDYIKEANLLAANINKGKLTSTNANDYAERIAGKTLTKAGLEAILATSLSSNTDGGGGGSSSGGSTGGGSSGGGSLSGGTSSETPSTPIYRPVSSEASQVSLFKDVSDSHWAFKQIDFLKKQNIISGKDENNFCPNDYLKREELTKIIISAFDIKGTGDAIVFEDVVDGAWYESYINAASSNGIIKGTSESTFGIGENVTRQDLCVMIVRAMEKEGFKGADLVFADKDEISSYAIDAVSYLNMMCVISGYEDNTFRPASPCTRAEAAKIIGDILNYEIKEVE